MLPLKLKKLKLLPFKIKKWQLWLAIVYISMISTSSWYCNPRDANCGDCGDNSTLCLIKAGNSAKNFKYSAWCKGFCYNNTKGCCGSNTHDHLSVVRKCGFIETDFIEPSGTWALEDACNGIKKYLLQFKDEHDYPNFEEIINDYTCVNDVFTKEQYGSFIKEWKNAVRAAVESDDEACEKWFIYCQECDGTSANEKKCWNSDRTDIWDIFPFAILGSPFRLSCNETHCAGCDASKSGSDDDDDDDDGGSTNDDNPTQIILEFVENIAEVGQNVIIDASIYDDDGVYIVNLIHTVNGDENIINLDKNDFTYIWNTETEPAFTNHIFKYVVTDVNGNVTESGPINITLTSGKKCEIKNEKLQLISIKASSGQDIEEKSKITITDENSFPIKASFQITTEENGAVIAKNVYVVAEDDNLLQLYPGNVDGRLGSFTLLTEGSETDVFQWDGKDYNGNYVLSGSYYLVGDYYVNYAEEQCGLSINSEDFKFDMGNNGGDVDYSIIFETSSSLIASAVEVESPP